MKYEGIDFQESEKTVSNYRREDLQGKSGIQLKHAQPIRWSQRLYNKLPGDICTEFETRDYLAYPTLNGPFLYQDASVIPLDEESRKSDLGYSLQARITKSSVVPSPDDYEIGVGLMEWEITKESIAVPRKGVLSQPGIEAAASNYSASPEQVKTRVKESLTQSATPYDASKITSYQSEPEEESSNVTRKSRNYPLVHSTSLTATY